MSLAWPEATVAAVRFLVWLLLPLSALLLSAAAVATAAAAALPGTPQTGAALLWHPRCGCRPCWSRASGTHACGAAALCARVGKGGGVPTCVGWLAGINSSSVSISVSGAQRNGRGVSACPLLAGAPASGTTLSSCSLPEAGPRSTMPAGPPLAAACASLIALITTWAVGGRRSGGGGEPTPQLTPSAQARAQLHLGQAGRGSARSRSTTAPPLPRAPASRCQSRAGRLCPAVPGLRSRGSAAARRPSRQQRPRLRPARAHCPP